MENELINFESALALAKSGMLVKRECVKNDTAIISYKSRLYQLCQSTGVRYPYVLTNADLHACDWKQVILKSVRNNALVDQAYKPEDENVKSNK